MAASKLLYWIAGLCGVVVWTGAIMAISSQPLPVELTLGGMGLVACAWGHSVLFPVDRSGAPPASPGRRSDMALQGAEQRLADDPRALGAPRAAVGRPRRPAILPAPPPPGERPAPLRTEASRPGEPPRLGEASRPGTRVVPPAAPRPGLPLAAPMAPPLPVPPPLVAEATSGVARTV
jgi:hypothetical protein